MVTNVLDTMAIPEARRDITKVENVRWLLRNLGVYNGHHPAIGFVTKDLKKQLRKLERDED